MDQHKAKLDTLRQIMDVMNQHMLGGAMKRKQPAVMEMTVTLR